MSEKGQSESDATFTLLDFTEEKKERDRRKKGGEKRIEYSHTLFLEIKKKEKIGRGGDFKGFLNIFL